MIATAEPTSENAVARATADLERIVGVGLRYGDEVTKRLRDLETLKQDSGVRVFERALSGDGAGLAREAGAVAAALQFELETLVRAEEARIEAQGAAIRNLHSALGDVEDKTAAETQAELDRVQPESDAARRHLAEIERVPPEMLGLIPPQAAGVPLLREGKTVATGTATRIVPRVTLRTELLRGEVAALKRKAAAIRAKPIVRAGRVEVMLTHAEVLARSADDVADEFITLATANHELVFPRVSEIRRVITDVFTREQARRATLTADHPHYRTPEFFELTWRDSMIVESQTRARLGVAHKVSVREGTTEVLSIDEWE